MKKRGDKIKIGIFLVIVTLFMISSVSAVTWQKNGTQKMRLDDDSGNLVIAGNYSTDDSGFFSWLGSLSSRITGAGFLGFDPHLPVKAHKLLGKKVDRALSLLLLVKLGMIRRDATNRAA